MRVAVTASQGRLKGLEVALAEMGHQAYRCPLTEVETIVNPAAAAALVGLRWWLFPSPAAVAAAVENELQPGQTRVGAVGPATAADLHAAGFRIDVVASPSTAEGLASAMFAHPLGPKPGEVVGAVQGDRARAALRISLSRARVELLSAVLYRSSSLRWSPPGEVDVVVLASPSALRALPRKVAESARFIAIGPTTAAALRGRGFDALEAETPTVAGVLAAVQRLDPWRSR